MVDRYKRKFRRSVLTNEGGFTLVEILIVVIMVAILAVIALLLINPARQRYKIWDIERKRELEYLKVLFENYYYENLQYPTGDQVCYDEPEVGVDGNCTCHICGLEHDPGTFEALVKLLYCDPEHPRISYLYEYDCDNPFPLDYRLYTRLSEDPTEGTVSTQHCNYGVANQGSVTVSQLPLGCVLEGEGLPGGGGGGGGPSPTPGGGAPTPTPPSCPGDPIPKYCELGGICNICGNFANCLNPAACDQPPVLFDDSNCTNRCL